MTAYVLFKTAVKIQKATKWQRLN